MCEYAAIILTADQAIDMIALLSVAIAIGIGLALAGLDRWS